MITLIIVAKAPEPGRVKTRLTPPYTPHEAAALAAAALLDTLDAVHAAAEVLGGEVVVALTGDLGRALGGEAIRRAVADDHVIAQRGADLPQRLAAAHVDAARLTGHGVTVQLGMDTPHVTRDLLVEAAESLVIPYGPDAVLGPADDGGWWTLGLREAARAVLLADIACSCPDTGSRTLAALSRGGSVRTLRRLRDIDTADDLAALIDTADAAHGSDGRCVRLARVLRASRADAPTDRLAPGGVSR